MGRRTVFAVVALFAALLSMSTAAVAAPVGISDFVARPIANSPSHPSTCAPADSGVSPVDAPGGAHRDFCVAFNLDTGSTDDQDVKKLTISLPAGVVGDPGATRHPGQELCSLAHDSSGKPSGPGDCDGPDQVGTVTAKANAFLLGTLSLSGEIYNVKPQKGEPARLGVVLDQGAVGSIGPTYLETAIRVRVPDAGLDSVTDNVPNNANGIPISLTQQSLLLWGPHTDTSVPAEQQRHTTMVKAFMSLPTRCDQPAVSKLTTQSYGGQASTAGDSFAVKECDKVPWTPDLEVGPTTAPSDTPGEAFAKLIVPTADTGIGDAARRQSYLKDVDLRLPAGLALNPPLAAGLLPCTPEQFGKDEDRSPDCPANTVMGTVEFRTPIFPGDVLSGKVYFGTPLPGIPLVNFISVEDPRLRVKLVGFATIDPLTTAITAHFTDQPQVPFESFKFTYIDPKDANGNSNGKATLTSPVACGDYPVTAAMTPWSSGAGGVVAPTKTFNVNECSPPKFQPSITAKVSDAKAGGDTALTIHIARPDKNLRLQGMKVSLPAGLTGRLPAVPACAVADARANRCAATSQVGTAAVSVGTGPAPLSLPGKVFLTDGFDGGIAGLAVTVDTKVPALDLGLVTVMSKLVLRPDTGIDVVTEPLPQSLQGIPTVYRSIDLTIDRAGFMRNASSCAGKVVHGDFTAVGGTAAAAEAPYQATGCESLAFAPKLTAEFGAKGENAKGGHPPLKVTIEQADGESAMAQTSVTLPDGIGVDLKNLKTACSDADLEAGSCPATSKLGTVTADTPLLPYVLSGGAYLTTPVAGHLPGIALDLGLTRLKGDVTLTPQGRLRTTFASVPDVPLRKLVLTLTGGKTAVLTTATDQCGATPAVDTSFTAQSGQVQNGVVPAILSGCDALKATGTLTGLKKKRPVLKLSVTSAEPLKSVRVKLPTTLKAWSKTAIRKKSQLSVSGKRRRDAVVSLLSNGIRFKAPATTAKVMQVSLPKGTLKLRKKIKTNAKVTFTLVAVTAKGAVLTTKAVVKAAR